MELNHNKHYLDPETEYAWMEEVDRRTKEVDEDEITFKSNLNR